MTNNEKKLLLTSALLSFKTSYMTLTELFRQLVDNDELDDAIFENYCFTESFDEINVEQWIDTAVKNLK